MLKQLDEAAPPRHEVFFSKLKNSNISEDEYAEWQKVWEDNKMTVQKKKQKYFLIWYNNKDLVPFMAALEKEVAFYGDWEIAMFKEAISIPGLSLKYLFQTLKQNVMITLCFEKQKELHTTLNSITSCPSIIFHRYILKKCDIYPREHW